MSSWLFFVFLFFLKSPKWPDYHRHQVINVINGNLAIIFISASTKKHSILLVNNIEYTYAINPQCRCLSHHRRSASNQIDPATEPTIVRPSRQKNEKKKVYQKNNYSVGFHFSVRFGLVLLWLVSYLRPRWSDHCQSIPLYTPIPNRNEINSILRKKKTQLWVHWKSSE